MDFIGPDVATLWVSVLYDEINGEGRYRGNGGTAYAIYDNTKDTVVMPWYSADDGTQRVVRVVEFFNTDTVNSRRIEFRRHQRSGFVVPIFRALVPSQGTLRYETETGWVVYDADGVPASNVSASGGGSGTMTDVVSFQAVASANLTLTNQAQAAQFLGNSNRNIQRVDLSDKTHVRMSARIVTGSASVNTPRIYVQYSTAFTTTVGSYLDIGTSACELSLTTAGALITDWIPLAAGAIGTERYITIKQDGGDGVADPALAGVQVYFK